MGFRKGIPPSEMSSSRTQESLLLQPKLRSKRSSGISGHIHSQFRRVYCTGLEDGRAFKVERRASCTGSNTPAFVDFVGGMGQILSGFGEPVPRNPSKFVLQGLPEVIDVARGMGVAESAIEFQAHDFFTPQVIKGAHAYFMNSVLHN
ncbi:hypothetical protein F5Y09DRAFT_342996 [Xylaria sp. FL1042]|nr:hypothetical protein F5Y09DRAFT_342996 [Xylaria sp. FL1042]